ncbi:hypothetical protein CYMTET_46864 [Cymbomonas tetramitiformis]|uniref:DNA methylase N-4/N-6 domain-containing protein n=1 Tax=Cymbomonas tetramitiformis TaxID=36881 RepID=A0AAE0BX89_9CHLO|nr:hypothetical protein CYMTET_46864 [Cymbomonas tetramitiformis]
MSMTFWNTLQGFAGDLEFDQVDEYLRQVIAKTLGLVEAGNLITQFKKERQVQKHLVAATGAQTWEEVKEMLGAHYCSQAKVESLIACLPSQKGGARRGAVQVPPGIITYVEQAKENVRRGAEAPASTERLNLSVTVKPRWKVYKASYADMKELPRLMYTGVIFDCVYQLDKEKSPDALTKQELQKFLEDFDAKTASPCWTIAVFCGFAQHNDFLEVIDGFCTGRAERFFLQKQNCHMNPNKTVRFNDIEVGVFGFHMKRGSDPEASGEGEARRVDWMKNFDSNERLSRASLIQGFPVVQQMFKRGGKTVNPRQKPQALLKGFIETHMLGEDPTATDENGHPKNWILDACCGVGSTSMAALRSGMNVIAFDNDPYMVSSAGMRLQNFDGEPDPADETKAAKAAKAAAVRKH